MQLDPGDHFREIVEMAIADYQQAEIDLTHAAQGVDQSELRRASLRALRFGGAAALYLHHFADIVARRPPAGLPDFQLCATEVRRWLAGVGADDVWLLGDVADALKHAVLTRGLPREVEEAGQVLAISRAFGSGKYGEGKFGGVDEVWILGRSGPRALSGVLESVRRVWRSLLLA